MARTFSSSKRAPSERVRPHRVRPFSPLPWRITNASCALRLLYTGAGDHRHDCRRHEGRAILDVCERADYPVPRARWRCSGLSFDRPSAPSSAASAALRLRPPYALRRQSSSRGYVNLVRRRAGTHVDAMCAAARCRAAQPAICRCGAPRRLARPSRGAARRPLGQSPPVKGAVMSRCVSRSHRQS